MAPSIYVATFIHDYAAHQLGVVRIAASMMLKKQIKMLFWHTLKSKVLLYSTLANEDSSLVTGDLAYRMYQGFLHVLTLPSGEGCDTRRDA